LAGVKTLLDCVVPMAIPYWTCWRVNIYDSPKEPWAHCRRGWAFEGHYYRHPQYACHTRVRCRFSPHKEDRLETSQRPSRRPLGDVSEDVSLAPCKSWTSVITVMTIPAPSSPVYYCSGLLASLIGTFINPGLVNDACPDSSNGGMLRA
jgi:hypothetical protein